MRYVDQVFTLLASTLLATTTVGCGGPAASETGHAPATAMSAKSGSACRQPLPNPALAVPAGNELDLQLDAVGVQIYACSSTAAGPAWVFTAPEATLSGPGGLAGKHYAGPTWELADGSKVVGAKVAGATADPSAIPWLLLRAVSHAGGGRLDEVTFIQRIATTGGLAPAGGCTAETAGAAARVPYTATYCFSEAK